MPCIRHVGVVCSGQHDALYIFDVEGRLAGCVALSGGAGPRPVLLGQGHLVLPQRTDSWLLVDATGMLTTCLSSMDMHHSALACSGT